MVKVIFIASLSHSGSTLLDLMLNAHPQVASVGELKQLGRFARLEKPNRQLRVRPTNRLKAEVVQALSRGCQIGR